MAARPVVYKINIGEGVLIAPNVTISTTNHPIIWHGSMEKCTVRKW